MYILLVTPPAVGKGQALNPADDLLKACGMFNVAPTALTKAAFVDQLKGAPNPRLIPGTSIMHNSLILIAPEFGTFLTAHDHEFLNTLNDIYDCRNIYEERTRGGGLISIERPHFAMIGGTQPKYLGDILPEAAYGQGYTSRLVMVYTAQGKEVNLFGKIVKTPELRTELIHDLKRIGSLSGEFKWHPDTKKVIEEWQAERWAPVPTHYRLLHYNGRRILHVIKLSMAHSAQRGDAMVIEPQDFEAARTLLLEAEKFMPEIFKEMTADSDVNEINEAFNHLWLRFVTNGNKPVSEQSLRHHLAKRVPVNKVDMLITVMIGAGMIKIAGNNNIAGMRKFEPVPEHLHGDGDG